MDAKDYLTIDGNKIHYDVLHRDLRNKYGRASKCEFCKSVTAKKFEWALKKDRNYSMSIGDYIQLCSSCHRKYDFTEELRIKLRKSKNVKGDNPAAKKIINIETGKTYNCLEDACKEVYLKKTTLSAMLTGQNPNKTTLKYVNS